MSIPVSPVVRKFAALGIAGALALAVVTLVVEPAARRLSELDAEITAKRVQLGRLAAMAASAQGASETIRRRRQLVASSAFLPGDNEAIQHANLQRLFQKLSETEGVRHQSIRTLQSNQQHGVQVVGLHVTSQISLAAFQRLLHRIETEEPVLLADGLTLSPIRGGALNAPNERLLRVDFRVLALVRPATQATVSVMPAAQALSPQVGMQ